MGAIRDTWTGRTRILESDHVVGRAPPPACSLTLDAPYISGVHAELRWTGMTWEVRDRGSRNGTYLDRRRLDPGVSHAIHTGSKLGFGTIEHEWTMIEDSAPPVMAIPLDGGEPALLEGEMLSLPGDDHARAIIYRTGEGEWILEPPDAPSAPIVHLQLFEAGGRFWRFCEGEPLPGTLEATDDGPDFDLTIRNFELFFSVSADEEYVHIRAACGGREFDLGARGHNYLLLTLARRRLADAELRLALEARGWIPQDELAHDPSMAPPQLNGDVFRIRRQFAKLGAIDAPSIIERRPRPWHLRIGTDRIVITHT